MQANKTSTRLLSLVIAVVVIFFILLITLNQFYINYLWFKEVGYTQVFFKELVTKLEIGLPIFIVLSIILYFYFSFLRGLLKRRLAIVQPKSQKDKYKITSIVSILVSLVITVTVTNSLWYKLLEYLNASKFNTMDPIFNKDISFYIFKLPLMEQLYSVLLNVFFIVLFASVIYSIIVLSLNGNKKIIYADDKKEEAKSFLKSFGNIASKQIGIFVGIFFLILALGYYIRIFTLLYSTKGIAFGASYTDINVTLWVYRISIGVCVLAFILSIINGFRNKMKSLLIGPALLILVSIGGGIISFAIESYIVAPNQFSKEEPYLVNNIEYTQLAYGVNDIEEKEFAVTQKITAEDLENNKVTVNNIPINDYRPTLDMYNSIQGFRLYYQFNDIDIDRYYIDGKYTQVFLSAREMNNDKLETNAKTWINQHLKYTHGFGTAVSPVNKVNGVGQPVLLVKDIPPTSEYTDLSVNEPRIYFGELSDTYAITNGKTMEFDYPEGSDNKENFYEGTAGIPMTPFNKLAFAINQGNMKIVLSSEISSNSKALIHRNIVERINMIAPFFAYDEDPYLTIVDGKFYWIIDGFTLSNRYPYSQPFNESNSFNYIRNSVKVVVDAYNGDVKFYQVDKNDPIANTYNKIYPNLLTPMEQMPEGIKNHIRYSQRMFDIQSSVYRTYHMNNPRVFYNKEDQWEIATQLYSTSKQVEEVESSYIVMKLPERQEEFILMVPYTPRGKDNMVGWMAGICDGDDYGKLILYKFPKQKLVYGPMQIEQRIDQDTVISPQLTLLGQQGSEIIRGNLLTVPIEESILYIEPIYIKASGGERSLPELKKVIVSFDNSIIMANSLQEALDTIFGENVGIDDEEIEIPDAIDGSVNQLIIKANELFIKAQDAQKSGNWSKYGEYIDQLELILQQLNQGTQQ